MFRSIGTINAIAVHRTFGLPGNGIVWAVVDSGVDGTHPHFQQHMNLKLPAGLDNVDFTSKKGSALKDEFEGARWIQELSYPSRYTPERQAFQAKLLKEFFQSGKTSDYPRVVFTSGAMGSGKTTAIQRLMKEGVFQEGEFLVINPDEIRKRLPEYQELLGGRYSEYAAELTQHETEKQPYEVLVSRIVNVKGQCRGARSMRMLCLCSLRTSSSPAQLMLLRVCVDGKGA